MISKLKILTIFLLIFSVLPCKSEEKFEGLIASVDSEAITTYDLSQRIKLVLKSLKLEDNIKNRDCLLYTSPSPRDLMRSRMPSSA